jgi:hypothetical protein
MTRFKIFMRVIASMSILFGIGGFSAFVQAWEGHKRAPWVGTMLNGTKCDGGQVPFGPYDYLQRNSLPGELEVVEESHFNENVESLTKGMSSSPMGDIHYTLQTWPNHHRALNSAFRYRLQHRELWGVGDNTAQNYPAECYLQRAMNFSPNDPIPYMLHGMLMHQMQQYEAALKSYRKAIKLRPDDLITQYNMGLTLVELKMLAEAQQVADKVYAADFPLPGLQRKLANAKRQKTKARVLQPKAAAPAATDKVSGMPGENVSKLSVSQDDKSLPSTVPTAPADTEAPPAKAEGDSSEMVPAQPTASKDKATEKGPPKLSPEQSAILEQAIIDQAAKTNKDAENSAP